MLLTPITVRFVVAAILTFFGAWVDVLGLLRGGIFLAFLTGNIILLGVSVSPHVVREDVGIFDNYPIIYVCLILAHLGGCFLYHFYIKHRKRPGQQVPGAEAGGAATTTTWWVLGPGTCVAIMIALPPLIVIPIYTYNINRSPWLGILFAPGFGAAHGLTTDPPLNCKIRRRISPDAQNTRLRTKFGNGPLFGRVYADLFVSGGDDMWWIVMDSRQQNYRQRTSTTSSCHCDSTLRNTRAHLDHVRLYCPLHGNP